MTKLTEKNKETIVTLLKEKIKHLGSEPAVANFLGKSTATINLIVNGKYATKNDDALIDIGIKLGWKPAEFTGTKSWFIAETSDYRSIERLLADAKNNSLFVSISDVAGIGKSACLETIAGRMMQSGIFYLRCFDWGKKEFLENLCMALGLDTGRGNNSPSRLLQSVIDFFKSRSLQSPLLIIDEADKLKDAAKMLLIPLYNELEDELGVVIAGTEFLEKQIKRGVKSNSKGFDEIDSRFGRSYLKLIGCTLSDTIKICNANGLDDNDKIKEIFEQCKPVRREIKSGGQVKIIRVTTDQRRLKRLVIKERIKQKTT